MKANKIIESGDKADVLGLSESLAEEVPFEPKGYDKKVEVIRRCGRRAFQTEGITRAKAQAGHI